MVFTPPSVPPFAGDRNLREEEENRPPVLGTASLYGCRTIKGLRHVVRDGTARGGKAICKYLNFLIWIEVLKETGSSLL